MSTGSPRAILGDGTPPPPRPVEDRDLATLARTGLHPLSLADLVRLDKRSSSSPLPSPLPSREV